MLYAPSSHLYLSEKAWYKLAKIIKNFFQKLLTRLNTYLNIYTSIRIKNLIKYVSQHFYASQPRIFKSRNWSTLFLPRFGRILDFEADSICTVMNCLVMKNISWSACINFVIKKKSLPPPLLQNFILGKTTMNRMLFCPFLLFRNPTG